MDNLPGHLTPLIGRERERATVRQLLGHEQVHLLTLTGPGGVGKTRLALQAARDCHEEFADGVAFLSLELTTDPDQVLPAVARALGLREKGPGSTLERLSHSLKDRSQLILLDNIEHVIEAGPALVALLTGCPRLKLLVTSREALGVRGEQEFAVPLLGLPDLARLDRTRSSQARSLANYSAVALFLERARGFKPEYEPDDEEMWAVAEICVLLNGLPLALELAAARMKLLSPQAMLGQLKQALPGPALRLLTGGARDLPARQRTLRQTIRWSYDLLDPAEQRLFRLLSIFAGPFSLSVAGRFIDRLSPFFSSNRQAPLPVLDGITSLHNKSLLLGGGGDGEPRLSMLLFLREFGREQLAKKGEMAAAQQAHALTYLALAETAASHLNQPDQSHWLNRLAADYDDLREALRWALAQEEAGVASCLGVALWPYWVHQGYLHEGLGLLDQILTLLDPGGLDAEPGDDGDALRRQAELLYGAGILAYRHYAWGEIRPGPYFEASLERYRRLGDERGMANVLTNLGRLTVRSGEFDEATRLIEEALVIQRRLDNGKGIAVALDSLSRAAMTRGAYDEAQAYAEECLAIYRRLGDRLGEADTLLFIGNIAFNRDDQVEAQARCEEAAALFQALGNRHGLANSYSMLGQTLVVQGDLEGAEAILQDALSRAREIGDERAEMASLIGLAFRANLQGRPGAARELWERGLDIARRHRLIRVFPGIFLGMAEAKLEEGEAANAVSLLSAADVFYQGFDFHLPPFIAPMFNEILGKAQSELEEEAFREAWAKGPERIWEAAPGDFTARHKDRVRAAPIPGPVEGRPPKGSAGAAAAAAGLTAREREVLGLVGRGLTDNQVAEKLVISPRTVHGHLRSIYSKLGVNSRTAATRWAIENGVL